MYLINVYVTTKVYLNDSFSIYNFQLYLLCFFVCQFEAAVVEMSIGILKENPSSEMLEVLPKSSFLNFSYDNGCCQKVKTWSYEKRPYNSVGR